MSTVGSLADLLTLTGDPAGRPDVATGPSVHLTGGRIYGGQILGQAAVAAARSATRDRRLHSLHAYFLRPGDVEADVEFEVERFRDGRSFSARAVRAVQAGKVIATATASFTVDARGPEHETPPPTDVPGPEEFEDRFPADLPGGPVTSEGLMQVRRVPGELLDGVPPGTGVSWLRVRHRLPDDPVVHRAALAYLSDAVVQDPVLDDHGLDWTTTGIATASLDHAMWWYRDTRADEWLLSVSESPVARTARGLALGRVYTRAGDLVAVIGQEVLARYDD
ncbi:acyl-CoA thioesterase [Kineococcus sp. SYSU DK001]|uniref:acyl-CoA thioesterase n=1 Tax=Kineococcus sp. SYSU DK001 TaxID=3383122 RepID=UPI003D7EBD36